MENHYQRKLLLIDHLRQSLKGSRFIILDKLISTEIYSTLISKVQNKPSSNIYFKICLMTVILTGQQSTSYHTLLRTAHECDLFNTKS